MRQGEVWRTPVLACILLSRLAVCAGQPGVSPSLSELPPQLVLRTWLPKPFLFSFLDSTWFWLPRRPQHPAFQTSLVGKRGAV